MEVQDLELTGIVAFDGLTKNGLLLHPDQEHFVHSMGNKLTINHIQSGKQSFLSGHTNLISALCISPTGDLLASGQINHMGFKALVIIWDYYQRKPKARHEIHKVRIESMAFSCDGKFLITLGGRDDAHVVVWDVEKNDGICGAFATSDIAGNAYTICPSNTHPECFVTGGDRTIKIWQFNAESKKIHGTDAKLGKLRRVITCLVIDSKDNFAYCGTTSGDIIKLKLNYRGNDDDPSQNAPYPIMVGCYAKISKLAKNRRAGIGDLWAGGVTQILLLEDIGEEKLLVGTGNGIVECVKILDAPPKSEAKSKPPSVPQIQDLMTINVRSAVTSMVFWKKSYVAVGTEKSEIYQIKLSSFDMRLLVTCHMATIYDITFPHNYSDIFATASKNDIRIWRLETQKELLRITVPNFVCTSLVFSHDGRSLVSAWNDGIIRAFTPQTGRLIFAILNAHLKAVSAIALTNDGKKIVSGGCDGQVRIWEIRPSFQKMLHILKEHRGSVTSLHMNQECSEVISSSTDGTCIIWDINRGARKQILMGNTMFMSARYSPNGVQVLTCGTDRKIGYWETLDGTIIRELPGSSAGALNCLDISTNGEYFVTGGNDSIVKLWSYETGETLYIGMGHAAIITACKISPNGKYIVTVSGDGAIIIWRFPFEISLVPEKQAEILSSRSSTKKSVESDKKNVNNIDYGTENIKNSDLTPRSSSGESVKAVYGGSANAKTCKCDPTQPSPVINHCSGGDTQQVPMIETARSVKSEKSNKSDVSHQSLRSLVKSMSDCNFERKPLI